MKLSFLALIMTIGISPVLAESSGHLDIMVPDLKDTDLIGPVKSVEVKLWQNVSADFITEKREYDRTGNLLQITEHDKDGKLVDNTTFHYDDDGCYERMVYHNKEKGYTNEWKVVLNPDTRQIALREIDGDRIGIESYSPEGYLISYRLLDANRKPIITREYKRNENNRLTMYKRIEGRKPAYTYFYKWAENGFIDMEAQTYHQDRDKRRHTYEYLVTDDQGNWTQRIMVRYDIGGKKPVKVYERTVQRKIEYFEDSAGGDDTAAADPEADGTNTLTDAEGENETL